MQYGDRKRAWLPREMQHGDRKGSPLLYTHQWQNAYSQHSDPRSHLQRFWMHSTYATIVIALRTSSSGFQVHKERII